MAKLPPKLGFLGNKERMGENYKEKMVKEGKEKDYRIPKTPKIYIVHLSGQNLLKALS